MTIDSTKIIIDPNDILRQKAEEVNLPLSKSDELLLKSMLEYVRKTHDEEYCEKNNCKASVGIAAPQVGVSKKMIAVSIVDEDQTLEFALVNPMIIANSVRRSYLQNGESCLSVNPDVEGIVPRYHKITIKAYNLLTNQYEQIRLVDYPSIVLQHEIDHLYGTLYYDHINDNTPEELIQDAVII